MCVCCSTQGLTYTAYTHTLIAEVFRSLSFKKMLDTFRSPAENAAHLLSALKLVRPAAHAKFFIIQLYLRIVCGILYLLSFCIHLRAKRNHACMISRETPSYEQHSEKAFDQRLKAFDQRLKAFDQRLKAFDQLLKKSLTILLRIGL
jgi:hypothetical protein